MKRFVKILIGMVAVSLAVILMAAVALKLLVDPNDYRAQIDRVIEHQIGRDVHIDGAIDLSVFPWLGLKLGHIRIANAPGFGDHPLAEIASAQVSVRLWPLLWRQIEAGTVSLEGLQLRLRRNRAGRGNWAAIAKRFAASQSDATASPQGRGPSGFDISSLRIAAIDIQNANISWHNAATGADYRATGVKLVTGRLSGSDPVRLELGGDLAAPRRHLEAKVHLVSRVEPHLDAQLFRFSNLSADVIASGNGVPAGRQQLSLGGHGELDLDAGHFQMSDFNLQAAGMNITGQVDATDLRATPVYTGRITVAHIDPRAVLSELGVTLPALADGSTLSKASFDSQFKATDEGVTLKPITATLDQSSLQGSVRLSDFHKPSIRFDLSVDKLNIDQYLPKGGAKPSDSSQARADGDRHRRHQDVDSGVLKALRLDGKLGIGSLTAARMQATDAHLALHARDGILNIEPMTATLYQGELRGAARIDVAHNPPRYQLRGDLRDVRFGSLMEDVAATNRLSAVAHMAVDLRSAGTQVHALKRALNGRIDVHMRNGTFKGFNLTHIIAAARRRLVGDSENAKSAANDGPDTTAFNRFAASFDIDDGVLKSRNFELDAPHIAATGRGRYDLGADELHYTVDAKVHDAAGPLKKLSGVTVPIQLTGKLAAPDYKLDMVGALRSMGGERLQQDKAELQDKLRNRLREHRKDHDSDMGDTIRHGLQDLFGLNPHSRG